MVTAGRVAAGVNPVARLYVDVPLPHLDRLFDYLVPEDLSDVLLPALVMKPRSVLRCP